MKLSKEYRSVSYDGMTAHVAIVFTQYTFLTVEYHENIDQRSLGELFYVTIDELETVCMKKNIKEPMGIFLSWLDGCF